MQVVNRRHEPYDSLIPSSNGKYLIPVRVMDVAAYKRSMAKVGSTRLEEVFSDQPSVRILPKPATSAFASTPEQNRRFRQTSGNWANAQREQLKRRIEQRPPRERLVNQHILHSDGRVAPLIEARCRLLRRETIRSDLSRKLQERPGPLELVTRKILQADAELEQAIQEGRLLFEPTSEEADSKKPLPRPFDSDMEVVSQVVIRPPHRHINVLSNKGILRKKSSPYKLHEPTPHRAKTKTPETKVPDSNAERGSNEASSYENLLKQQQLFLQWQKDEKQQSNEQVIELQTRESPSITPILTANVRRLNDMRVQELKNECKKRQLPVSGAKPQLLVRLRQFEKEITGISPPPSPAVESPTAETSSSDEPEIIEANHQHSQVTAPTVLSQPMQPPQQTQMMTEPSSRPSQVTIHDYLQSQSRPVILHVPQTSSQIVQIVDAKGVILGTATIQCPTTDQGQQPAVLMHQPLNVHAQMMAHPINTHSDMGMVQPMQTQQMAQIAGPARLVQATQVVQKQPDNTFRFAQMGSGGQFTVVPNDRKNDQMPKAIVVNNLGVPGSTPLTHIMAQGKMMSGHVMQSVQGQQPIMMQPVVQTGVVQGSQPILLSFQTTPSQQTSQPKPDGKILTQVQSMPTPAITKRLPSPSVQSSPRTADLAGSSPNMPQNGGSSQMETDHEDGTNENPINLEPTDPATLLTPATLSMHEEMLRNQQKLIEDMIKELAKSQQLLKEQQQLILSAKKSQQKLREQQKGDPALRNQREQWLSQLDIRHLNKQHIQQFLNHKVQAQKLQQHTAEHNRLANTEVRLQEEVHVEQAIEDIVRLIKQDVRTALLIVQLLRKYQVERAETTTGDETAKPMNSDIATPMHNGRSMEKHSPQHSSQQHFQTTSVDTGHHIQKNTIIVQQAPVVYAEQKQSHQLIQTQSQHQPQPKMTLQQQGTQSTVDMEEIFKTVLEDATRAIREGTPEPQPTQNHVNSAQQQLNMNLTPISMSEPQQWHITQPQSAMEVCGTVYGTGAPIQQNASPIQFNTNIATTIREEEVVTPPQLLPGCQPATPPCRMLDEQGQLMGQMMQPHHNMMATGEDSHMMMSNQYNVSSNLMIDPMSGRQISLIPPQENGQYHQEMLDIMELIKDDVPTGEEEKNKKELDAMALQVVMQHITGVIPQDDVECPLDDIADTIAQSEALRIGLSEHEIEQILNNEWTPSDNNSINKLIPLDGSYDLFDNGPMGQMNQPMDIQDQENDPYHSMDNGRETDPMGYNAENIENCGDDEHQAHL